jgi:hypothetical protein
MRLGYSAFWEDAGTAFVDASGLAEARGVVNSREAICSSFLLQDVIGSGRTVNPLLHHIGQDDPPGADEAADHPPPGLCPGAFGALAPARVGQAGEGLRFDRPQHLVAAGMVAVVDERTGRGVQGPRLPCGGVSPIFPTVPAPWPVVSPKASEGTVSVVAFPSARFS